MSATFTEFPSDLEDLKNIIISVIPVPQPIPKICRHISRFVSGADMDEVYPNLWLGDCDAATNVKYLERHNVSHILNAAANTKGPASVKTGPDFYKRDQMKYMGLDLIDLPFVDISVHFEVATNFIYGALKSGGIVLVHCRQGRSRSATLVIAFLMLKMDYTAADALKRLRQYREVRPNNSFLQQIANLDLKLFRRKLDEKRRLGDCSDSQSSNE